MISIVIPTHQNPRGLHRLLQSLQGCGPAEIWIVANPPDEKVAQICQSFAGTHYLQSSEIGVNRARNLGLRAATQPVVLFLDDDCVVEDRALLEKHLHFHETNPQALAYGGAYHLAASATRVEKVYNFVQMTWLHSGLTHPNFRTKHLLGGHFSLKKACLAAQEFDENIRYGGSELEFFRRLLQLDHSFFLGPISVLHAAKVTPWSLHRKAWKQGVGKAYLESLNYRDTDSLHFHFERELYWNQLKSFGRVENLLLSCYQISFQRAYSRASARFA